MTTITVNERTKAGKIVLELAKMLSVTNKGVVIDQKEEDQSVYSDAFVAKIKRAEENIKNGETKTLNPNDVWGSLGLK
jgi:uncharacterized protein YrrD